MRHWDALLPGRVLHVPYEQLVGDQEAWSRRLLQHCGLPWDDSVLEFHKTERDVQTASLSQARDCSCGPFMVEWRRACKGPLPAVMRVWRVSFQTGDWTASLIQTRMDSS